jgi:streptogramin lyase
MDGRMVALTIDPSGEIWVVASMVSGLFGFNPATTSWDRTINLPFVPTHGADLRAPAPGILTVRGVTLHGGAIDATSTGVFAMVTTSTKAVKILPVRVRDYVLAGNSEIIYSDDSGTVATLSLINGQSTTIATAVPLGGNPSAEFALDSKGHLWFQLSAYRSVGVAELNLTTGAVTRFNFPYVVDPGGPGPANTCPTGAFHCIPDNAVYNPGIQAIVVDQRDNVWVVTEAPANNDPNQRVPVAPIMELQPSD